MLDDKDLQLQPKKNCDMSEWRDPSDPGYDSCDMAEWEAPPHLCIMA